MDKEQKKIPMEKLIQRPNFSKEIEAHRGEAFKSGYDMLFSVAIQEQILREWCHNNTCGFRWTQPHPPLITPLSHTISVSIQVLDQGKEIMAEGLGISTRYSWEYVDLAKNAATELATTIAKGKALCDIGIIASKALRSVEEQTKWEEIQKIQVNPDIGKIALAFSVLDEDVKYSAQKQGIDIQDFIGVYKPGENTPKDMKNMILEGTILKVKEEALT